MSGTRKIKRSIRKAQDDKIKWQSKKMDIQDFWKRANSATECNAYGVTANPTENDNK